MSVLLLHAKQSHILRTLVMGLDEINEIFKLAVSHKIDAITLFRVISGFRKPSHWSGWDEQDIQSGNFHEFDAINFSSHFQILRKEPFSWFWMGYTWS